MSIKELLEEYRFLIIEVTRLSQRLERLQDTKSHIVTDTVRGSSHNNPYQERIIAITGISKRHMETVSKVEATLRKRIKQTRESIVAVEEFIAAVPHSKVRQAIECYYVQGMTWAQVAREVYKHASEDTPRKAVESYLAKQA